MSFSHWAWFSIVALFFSAASLRRRMLAKQRIIDRVIGVALIALAGCLVLPGLGFT
jgi:threonine/homoserine/homoserine lactone efflux protein